VLDRAGVEQPGADRVVRLRAAEPADMLRRYRSDPHAVAYGLGRPGAELRALRVAVRAARDRYARPG
jgi:hypothetical protein